jgi:putative alpha-1,2-mannosidase
MPINRTWLFHDEIIHGGKLTLQMGNQPNYQWGILIPDKQLSAAALK